MFNKTLTQLKGSITLGYSSSEFVFGLGYLGPRFPLVPTYTAGGIC